ncbi:uncharacterized protein si:ch211-216l23.2 isoform X1 [Salmo trutta]|uniref:uncharacterized protein si:ch211-216l23.2 isoform X1 n=2 Tax=Salmo trutta TaxID=8032 RepID=UPI001130A65F|nr:uncharacterized protein LOC115196847 isoform X1 [Salmo trutta]XP_029613650.1 uncharacterized protein LOC115196847 isoform X1 [Salmo trutta]XP_029613651.1 uncharacterized protein LOC115196847 isoform X1 [Salmo trutta]XP_029613652.1 uncharacterized protein LOC115196847 isoform X1 [Salmo trutta]XP_029613653.1 uncharacterized protein LOC115196847 isoform X1 [Salmo trutta]XP_029613654.1 uncharacterized protein LOC115196847 isoform X1 [Salmo trutta]
MSEDEDFSNCVHCNMPKDHAMDFVMAEYGRGLGQRMQQKDPAETGARAAELVDDYLEREKVEKHAVPSDTRQLHFFLADGVHLYPEELSTIAKYLHNCQHHLQAMSTETGDGPLPERTKMLPPGLGKPPPLLPTPSGPRGRETPPWRREHSATHLMTSPGPRLRPLHCCPCTRVKGPLMVPHPLAPPFLHTASVVHYIEDPHTTTAPEEPHPH